MKFDLILRGGTVITSEAQTSGDVAIKGGVIRAIVAPGAALEARNELDVSGKLLFPGFVDAHVHIPGHILNTKLDNYTTATRAEAAGGVTTLLLQPTDDPCSVTPHYFEKKRIAGEGTALVDFALQAMVSPKSEDEHIDELSALGAVSFEIYLAYGGMPGFIIGDSDYQLHRAMDMIGAVGGIAGVTPHSPSLMTELTNLKRGRNGSGYPMSKRARRPGPSCPKRWALRVPARLRPKRKRTYICAPCHPANPSTSYGAFVITARSRPK